MNLKLQADEREGSIGNPPWLFQFFTSLYFKKMKLSLIRKNKYKKEINVDEVFFFQNHIGNCR
jgi:hypothetical protein